MKQNGWFSRYVLIWTYGRGTLQYDIICILILAFIFLIDPGCFNKRHYETTQLGNEPSTIDQSLYSLTDPEGSKNEIVNPE
ncbi:MAG: hypothetical protein P8Z37_03195 [Acidobacteriota bacterium]|jgi:hypothetical protein